jgi:4-hydroxy-tetrahydrodipicolinate reductase
MALRICIAGATGWVGRCLVPAVLAADDLELSGAVARAAAGQDAGTAIGLGEAGVTVVATVAEALREPTDVLIDYTKPDVIRDNVFAALDQGVSVVVGTSGLTGDDYAAIAAKAEEKGAGVVGSGNFSVTAALLQHFALFAAEHVPQWEVIDYGGAAKPDVPSGTARELAEKLGAVRPPVIGYPVDKLSGAPETRGADIAGVRVHSVRLPGYYLSCEAVFGLAGERLTLRHDAGASGEIYVAGTLLAARKAPGIKGLVRGIDTLMF